MGVAVITGLKAEAALLRGYRAAVLSTGGRPDAARFLAERLAADGATVLISFGVAGGLAPDLRPGCVVLATAVITEADFIPTDAVWRNRLHARIPDAVAAPVHGAAALITTAAAKRAVADRTGAVAVDLESAGVAAVAHRLGLPFAVVRAIADPADFDLPPAVPDGLNADGSPAVARVLSSVVRRPGQVPALLRLAYDTRTALRALRGVLDR